MCERGIVGSARGFLPGGHLCWAYHDRSDFLARAAEYLTDGLTAGQYAEYAADQAPDALRGELAGAAGTSSPVTSALEAGHITAVPVGDVCEPAGPGGAMDPHAAAAARAAAAAKALAGGYTGFRAVIDCTPLARTAGQREALARFEHLIDQKMTTLPLTALHAYDADELGADAVAEMACLHPFASPGTTPFRLHAGNGT